MTLELAVKNRDIFGKQVKTLRQEGLTPGEIYGKGMENIHISIEEKALVKVYRAGGENTVVTLSYGTEKIPTLISHISFNTLSGDIASVDFHKIKMNEKIRTHIPIVLEGKDIAKENGFDLVQTLDECEIEALPNEIPHEFRIDTSLLGELGQTISVKDIPSIKGVKILLPLDTVIIAVTEKQKEIIEEKPIVVAEEPVAEEKAPEEKKETK